MKKHIAIAISVIFHPMLMPLLGFFLIFNAGTHISFVPPDFRRVVYVIAFASACVLPLSILPVLLQFKLINSFKMESHRERIFPVLITGVFYFLGYILLRRFNLPLFLYQFMLGSLVALYAALVITFWWKISLHLVGIGGVTGAIIALSLKMGLGVTPALAALFCVAGLIASARLYLDAHTPKQTLAGYLLGLFVVMAIPFFQII
ncbi:MAG: PAP2 family protein [Breznakibacter sp.]